MTTTLDPSLSVRGKIIAALKADLQLAAIVPAARVYPSKPPASLTWPFIRVPLLVATPDELDGGSGSRHVGVIHCFTKAGPGVPDAEAQAADINRHIVRIVSNIDETPLDDGESVGVHVRQSQVIPDPDETDASHGIVRVEAYAT